VIEVMVAPLAGRLPLDTEKRQLVSVHKDVRRGRRRERCNPQAGQRGDPPQRRGRFQNAFRYLREVAARPGAAFLSAEELSHVLAGSNQVPDPSPAVYLAKVILHLHPLPLAILQ
jgi:hypothetical protein